MRRTTGDEHSEEFYRRWADAICIERTRRRGWHLIAESVELTTLQLHALALIRGLEPLGPTVSSLAAALCHKRNTTVDLLDRLVERGLCRRLTRPDDKRCKLVIITAKGQHLLDRVAARIKTKAAPLIEAHFKIARTMQELDREFDAPPAEAKTDEQIASEEAAHQERRARARQRRPQEIPDF